MDPTFATPSAAHCWRCQSLRVIAPEYIRWGSECTSETAAVGAGWSATAIQRIIRNDGWSESTRCAVMLKEPTIDVLWTGPYAWPEFEAVTKLPPIPKHPGVYLTTVEHQNGFLIYAAGITRRPVPIRFREHARKYTSGDYTVLDIDAMRRGERVEVWHGWGWTQEKWADFERRRAEILAAARRQLEGFRIFVADIGNQPRILDRLEGAIMNWLYVQPPPISTIPDKGMYLAPRRDDEPGIVARNSCAAIIHGLPATLEI